MLKQNRWIILTLALIVLIAGSIATIAIAAPTPPWRPSSADTETVPQASQLEIIGDTPDENGFTGDYQAPDRQATASSAVEGLTSSQAETNSVSEAQPDEDGYTGALPERAQGNIEPSAGADTIPQPDWSAFHAEPQLDDNVDGESMAPTEPGWDPLFSYVHVAGSALRPRDSSVEWNSTGDGGCVYNNGGSTSVIFNINMDIPDDVLIEYLRIYYYDTSAANSYAWITTYDDAGGYTDVVNVASDADTGYGTMLSDQIAHVVSLIDDSYVLNWRPYDTGSTMALCGLRVAYRLPDAQ